MTNVGERLKKAIDRWAGGGVMAFVKVMKGEGRGGTYPAVKRYIDGDTEPGLKFLERAADVLEVSFAWLATGHQAERPDWVKPPKPVGVATMDDEVVVVCDDGSVWTYRNYETGWRRGEPVPFTERFEASNPYTVAP